jgi:conserved domain protein
MSRGNNKKNKKMELKKYKLADIAKIEISGVDKKTIEGEIPVRLCNFVDVYHNWAITKDKAEHFMLASAKQAEIDKCSIAKGQVAITKDSETRDDIGIATYFADDFDNVVLGYHCALITPDPTIVDGKYLNAFMHTKYIQKYFENNASGSGQRYTLSNSTINTIPVLLPSLTEQHTIGKVLADIDRKIELNKQINDNLEAMAKQLYDYWFVQFDFPNEEGKPYKSSGGAMVWNEKLKREIPKGWFCGTLLDIAEYTNGLACQKYRPTDDNKLPVIKIKEMHDGLSVDTEWVKADIPDDVKVFDGDVLFSWSASLEVMLWAYGNGGLNQHIFKVTSKNGYPRSFYFYQLVHYIGVFKQMAEARKTTMGHITQDHLRQSTIVLPPDVDIANKLEEKLCPIFDAIVKNSQEIMTLTKQRDELLPLLMNGQATVNYHLSDD